MLLDGDVQKTREDTIQSPVCLNLALDLVPLTTEIYNEKFPEQTEHIIKTHMERVVTSSVHLQYMMQNLKDRYERGTQQLFQT